MRKALLTLRPKSIKDIAICLAIIRPAAKDTRKEINNIDKMKFKKVKQVSSLYLRLNPKLFKQKLLSFLKELK